MNDVFVEQEIEASHPRTAGKWNKYSPLGGKQLSNTLPPRATQKCTKESTFSPPLQHWPHIMPHPHYLQRFHAIMFLIVFSQKKMQLIFDVVRCWQSMALGAATFEKWIQKIPQNEYWHSQVCQEVQGVLEDQEIPIHPKSHKERKTFKEKHIKYEFVCGFLFSTFGPGGPISPGRPMGPGVP